jgi:hypothetical protein
MGALLLFRINDNSTATLRLPVPTISISKQVRPSDCPLGVMRRTGYPHISANFRI